jgi:hypothetical protein
MEMTKKKDNPVRINIYLDDERKPPVGFIGVTTAQECIDWLKLCQEKGTIVTMLSLDHDLGYLNPDTLEEETGYDVLCWLEQNVQAMPENIVLHTANPVGRRRMQIVLDAIERRKNA